METYKAQMRSTEDKKKTDMVIGNGLTGILPASKEPQDWIQEGAREMSAKRMLVIDDEAKIREMYRRIFYSIGYGVVTTGNAMDAHILLERNEFDLVLLDIKLAEADGSVIFKEIREFHKNIKVVVASVYSVYEQKERIKDADGYFDKSDDKAVLMSLISSLVEG